MSPLRRSSTYAGFQCAQLRSILTALAVAVSCSLATAPVAQAKSKKEPHGGSKSVTKKGSSKAPATQRSPSEETRAERERRLYRECKGMPNAGACKGFTQR